MGDLQERVRVVLSEARILVLGSEVVLGFQFRAAFEEGFSKRLLLGMDLIAAVLMVLAIAMLMLPGCYHRIVAAGDDTPGVLATT